MNKLMELFGNALVACMVAFMVSLFFVMTATAAFGQDATLPGFTPWEYSVSEENTVILNDIVDQLKENGDLQVTLVGHTDNVGSYSDNEDLSYNRAAVVHNILVQAGISTDRISVIGESYNFPVADNNTSAGRKANRRVEVTLYTGPITNQSPNGSDLANALSQDISNEFGSSDATVDSFSNSISFEGPNDTANTSAKTSGEERDTLETIDIETIDFRDLTNEDRAFIEDKTSACDCGVASNIYDIWIQIGPLVDSMQKYRYDYSEEKVAMKRAADELVDSLETAVWYSLTQHKVEQWKEGGVKNYIGNYILGHSYQSLKYRKAFIQRYGKQIVWLGHGPSKYSEYYAGKQTINLACDQSEGNEHLLNAMTYTKKGFRNRKRGGLAIPVGYFAAHDTGGESNGGCGSDADKSAE